MRRWRGVHDLLRLVGDQRTELHAATAVFVPAALSDFTLERRPGKIPSAQHENLQLSLHRAPKVLPELRRLAPSPTRIVAFKLEPGTTADELEAAGRALAKESGADWVVANDTATMGASDTNALVLPPAGGRQWIRGPKDSFAGKLLDDVGRDLANLVPADASPSSRRTRTQRPRHRRR